MLKFCSGMQASLVLAIAGCISLGACGSHSKNTHPGGAEDGAVLQNVPGEDSSIALLLGQGLDSVKNEAKGHCVTLGELKPQSGNVTGQMAEFEMLEITSESSLKSSLNISGSASFNALFARGSARMNYASSVNKNSQSKFLMVHTRVANQLELASSFTYTPAIQNLLKSDKATNFFTSCGNEFVYGRRTGGEFYAVFEFEMTSEEETKAFSSAVSASGAGWKAAVEINAALEKFNMFSLLQLRMLKFGGTAGLPQVENLKDFSLKFDQMTSAVSGSPITLELITKKYDGVEPHELQPNLVSAEHQLFIVGKLAEARDTASEMINSLHYIARNDRFYNTDGFDFDDAEGKLNNYINNIQLQAVQCFDTSSSCKMPEILPAIKLPPRKSATDLWEKLQTNHWSFSYPADQGAYLDEYGEKGGWIVKPGLTSLGNGEIVKLKVQYSEEDCTSVFAHLDTVGRVKPFFINDKLDVKTAIRNDPVFDGKKDTQIEFAIKDKESNQCLLAMFYTAQPLKNYITMNEDSEIGRTIRGIMKSIKRI